MASSLIQPLFDGSLDLVGDVHGEIDALHSLMRHLDYDDDGAHPDGRRLVFVGDLTDRGPDSPAVVSLVQRLVESERAQCVLGNHDLNILLDHRKHENKWFFGEAFMDRDGNVVPHEITLNVNKGTNGQVNFEATVTNGGNPRQKYFRQFEFGSEVVGPLNRIGLERSGRTGGAGLFGPATIDLSRKR